MSATATRKRKPVAKPAVQFETVRELIDRLGGIPTERVRMSPLPGTATKKDLIRVHNTIRRCELVDGTLVEKPMGDPESYLAIEIAFHIRMYQTTSNLGFLYGEAALIELLPNVVRGPDVSFTPWSATPRGLVPRDQISKIVPPLVVEVLSPSNTRGEIDRKIGEYFSAGVVLVWVIDPKTRTAVAYTAPEASTHIPATGTLSGDPVLPGFQLPLPTLFQQFDEVEKQAKPPRKKKK